MDTSEVYYPAAFALGALHSFEPGHGKTVMVAYLVGSRRRLLDAALLSVIITITHTFSVIFLGVAAWVAAERYRLEVTGPVFSLIGGLLILGVGLWMIVRWRAGACVHPGHGHHVHEHRHVAEQPHDDEPADSSVGQLVLVGIAGGIVPCPAGVALLMTTVAAGHLAQGLGLAAVFSLGVGAVVLTISVIICKATSLTTRWLAETSPVMARLPLISGLMVTALGLWLSGTAVLEFTRH